MTVLFAVRLFFDNKPYLTLARSKRVLRIAGCDAGKVEDTRESCQIIGNQMGKHFQNAEEECKLF